MFPTTFEFFVLITNHPSLVFFEGQRASPNEIPVLVPIFYQIFYLAVPLAFSPLRLLVRARNSLVEQGQGLQLEQVVHVMSEILFATEVA